MNDTTKFQAWAVVELFGHQRIAGQVSEQAVGGCAFVRVDVPTIGDEPGFTKLLGNGAIYAINIVSEEVARATAANIRALPVTPYDLPILRQRALALGDEHGDSPRNDS